jgi:hypothetical protein
VDSFVKCARVARPNSANTVLEPMPQELDRIELRCVWGQELQADAMLSKEFDDLGSAMCAEIVEHDNLYWFQARDEILFAECQKHILVSVPDSMAMTVTTRVKVMAPGSVVTRPRFLGMSSRTGCPLSARPRMRVIAVCTPDSSRKTRFSRLAVGNHTSTKSLRSS